MRYVDTQGSLQEALEAVEKAPWAAVDTEADSLHHYVEKLCLLQVSVPAGDFVIDPLCSIDPGPLVKSLAKRPLILHGADFDIRILNKTYGFTPAEMFDTVLAAQVLGYEKQGYADLVEKHCGIKLSKSSQKADWSRRPLDAVMLDYAVNDTMHLKKIRDIMAAELAELGRAEWHAQFCARLLRNLAAPREEREITGREWQIKGSKELKGKALTILRALWYWRDEEARRRDRPSFKVLNSEYLTQMAKWAAENPGVDISLMPRAPANARRELRDPLNRVIHEASQAPQAIWAFPPKERSKKRWGGDEERRFGELKALRQKLADELKITASLIATNATLEALCVEAPKDREAVAALGLLLPWQQEVIGDDAIKILSR